MPPPLILDPREIDITTVQYGQDEIRKENPHRHELELLHGVLHFDPEAKICIGVHHTSPDDFWVRGHIPGRPLMPGVLMIEFAAQLCSFYWRRANPDETRFFGFGGIDDTRFRGTVTPGDLGLGRMISDKKSVEFLGKRSLRLADLARPDRPHLVGLRSNDGKTVLPEGGQLIKSMGPERPLPREGHVTSSCLSPSQGIPIALALLDNGHNRIGEKVHVYSEGRAIPVTVAEPQVFDPDGDRLRL